MKLNYIYLDGYKNLNKIELEFEEDSCVNAIIGNNGSGKSNILEALTIVFSSIYNDKEVGFVYEIHYSIENSSIVISNREGESFRKDDKEVKKTDRISLLPRSVFLYYCGETERLREFAQACEDKRFDRALKQEGIITSKYLSFVALKGFTAAILANAIFRNITFDRMCDLIGIDEIAGPVVFKLKRPAWSRSAPITEDSFWNARGTVAMLLHAIKDTGSMRILDRDHAQIEVKSIYDIRLDAENPFDLYVRFELLIQTGILDGIDCRLIKDGTEIAPSELSEGEKQLAQLLSLLEATKEYRALFLLDEFDAFLHPGWQRRFAEIIDTIDIQGQVIFTTHSPLTLGKMKKENIRILKDGNIYIPALDTYNRDITEVLDEIMDVPKRPPDIERTIRDFKNTAMHGRKDQALIHLETLKGLLSSEDPFWITAEHYMLRLERKR